MQTLTHIINTLNVLQISVLHRIVCLLNWVAIHYCKTFRIVCVLLLMCLRPAVGTERSQAWSVMTETRPGQIEDPPIQLPCSSLLFSLPLLFLRPCLRSYWWQSWLLLKWLAALLYGSEKDAGRIISSRLWAANMTGQLRFRRVM